MTLNRRSLLASAAAAAIVQPFAAVRDAVSAGNSQPFSLRAVTRGIEVNGRAATAFGLLRPDGGHGLLLPAGSRFNVALENGIADDILIHWHGLKPPPEQDGVPGLSQAPITAGSIARYDFPVGEAGTYWMHAHHGLHEQRLMAAPLIVSAPEDESSGLQEIVVLLHDFSFRAPEELLAELQRGTMAGSGGAAAIDHGSAHGSAAPTHDMSTAMPPSGAVPHLSDVAYDAYLANDRALDDPAIYRVNGGGRVRLRIINGGTATNFWIDVSSLGNGSLIAVDGQQVEPIAGQYFGFAGGQRLDIVVSVPRGGGAFPVFALPEGKRQRTGFILATPGASIRRQPAESATAAPAIDLAVEARLSARRPLVQRTVDRRLKLRMGEAAPYRWGLNWRDEQTNAAAIRRGERVEITFENPTSMAHPMHLHGHRFQVVAIGGTHLRGAIRDTVLVPASGTVTIAFDADNPGTWALHCHQLYHMAAGMMTTIGYRA